MSRNPAARNLAMDGARSFTAEFELSSPTSSVGYLFLYRLKKDDGHAFPRLLTVTADSLMRLRTFYAASFEISVDFRIPNSFASPQEFNASGHCVQNALKSGIKGLAVE